MRELSLNILDIAENSVKACASNIKIEIVCDEKSDFLSITISDDGKGMSENFLNVVTDPFTTTRTTRKVGMGIPLFKMSAIQAEGDFEIESKENVGTVVKATYKLSHIDRMPLGDIVGTMIILISANPTIDFVLCFSYNGESFEFETKKIKEVLDGVPINDLNIINYLKGYLTENIENIHKGEI